jgi:hypothetical protein
VCRGDLPLEDDTEEFEIITVNHAQKRVVTGFLLEYKATAISGFVSKAKQSLVSQYLYLQIIKPHQINPDLVKVEFVGVNTNGFKLKKLR